MEQIPHRLNDLNELLNRLDYAKPLFLDTETNYLYKGIRLVQMYQDFWDCVLVFDIRDFELKKLYSLIKDAYVIFHNYTYDASCFVEDLGLLQNPFKRFEDTLLLARIYNPTQAAFSLDACFEHIYGYDVYSRFGVEKKEMQRSFLSTKTRDMSKKDLTDLQIQYACADVYFYPKFWDKLAQYTNDDNYVMDKEFISNALRWQNFGMPVNEKIRCELFESVEKEIVELTDKLPKGLNVNSPKQVKEFLNIESSSKDVMSLLAAGGNEVAELVLAKRAALKTQNFLERYNFERVLGYFAPTTISGRVRCDGGDKPGTDNLLQIPRRLKSVFGFDEKDERFLVYCDYAQLELRSACCLTAEHNIAETFRRGVDLHTSTAVKMFGGDYESLAKDKVKRVAAKFCNFSLLYCGSAKSLQSVFLTMGGIQISLEQAAEYKKLWLEGYPGFGAWHNAANKQYVEGKMLSQTANGRKYNAKLFTDICGIANQSIGADAAKTALNIFLKKEPNAKVLVFIHDSITLEAENEQEARRLARVLGESMVEGWFYAIRNCPINDLPMPLEVNIGKNFGTIETDGIVAYKTEGLKPGLNNPTAGVKQTLFEETSLDDMFKSRDLIIDADTMLYIAAYENEGNSFEECQQWFRTYIKGIREKYQPKSMKLFLSIGSSHFRYMLDENYKANRDRSQTPEHLGKLKRWALETFENVFADVRVEADDLVVLEKRLNPSALIFAIDKDILKAVAGTHYNYTKNIAVTTSEQEARFWPYLQTIVGDSSDGIKGVPGLGEKKAAQFISPTMDEKTLWAGVLTAYRSKGLSEEDAIKTMRLVRMDQWDGEHLRLWYPPV